MYTILVNSCSHLSALSLGKVGERSKLSDSFPSLTLRLYFESFKSVKAWPSLMIVENL